MTEGYDIEMRGSGRNATGLGVMFCYVTHANYKGNNISYYIKYRDLYSVTEIFFTTSQHVN